MVRGSIPSAVNTGSKCSRRAAAEAALSFLRPYTINVKAKNKVKS